MFPDSFHTLQLYQKKKDILLYQASDGVHSYMLKCTFSKDPAIREAFQDEYRGLSSLYHPSLPAYFGLSDSFILPGESSPCLALCMEDCRGANLLSIHSLSLSDIMKILSISTELLLYLLKHGILYTDLNPANLLLQKEGNNLQLTLIDFTFCYYFLQNPHPAYSLRFSYNLSPELRGQQLLIQELAFLLEELLEQQRPFFSDPIPSSVYRLMETGMHPTESLTLSDFLFMIQEMTI